MSGHLALVGGGEFGQGCSFDADLLTASGADEVLVLPTGAAFEKPERLVDRAIAWFAGLGVAAVGLPVLRRPDAEDRANATRVAGARFLYVVGGSPLHLRSVLKATAVWAAVQEAWASGATIAGSGESASALCDPMVDPRGGAFTVGLGLVSGLAVLPHAGADVAEHHRRTLDLARGGVVLAAVPDATAIVRAPDGAWHTAGTGKVRVFVDGEERSIEALPAG